MPKISYQNNWLKIYFENFREPEIVVDESGFAGLEDRKADQEVEVLAR